MTLYFFLCFLYFNKFALGLDFNVKDYGAKADGKTNDAKAFEATWNAACGSSGHATMLIPKGIYWMGPLNFRGPCKNATSITIKMEGVLKADTNLKNYPADWIFFFWIDRLTITGTGTFDGQGHAVWHQNDCIQNQNCRLLPINLKFVAMNNTVIEGITSLNSKYFSLGIVDCKNFRARGLHIIAPADSPNTDGMHLERSSDVIIDTTTIGVGDDCISLGRGLSNVLISGINCGPGHGISIGSLGRYANEKDVTGIIIQDSILSHTMNGVRIKSLANSPSVSSVSNITYDNIIMNNVTYPIIIDQRYCPHGTCSQVPSRVKISDVRYNNIRGTSSMQFGVSLQCSKGFPCKNVKLNDINIKPSISYVPASTSHEPASTSVEPMVESQCLNVKPLYSGTQIPRPCT